MPTYTDMIQIRIFELENYIKEMKGIPLNLKEKGVLALMQHSLIVNKQMLLYVSSAEDQIH